MSMVQSNQKENLGGMPDQSSSIAMDKKGEKRKSSTSLELKEILIVEDNINNSDLMKAILESQGLRVSITKEAQGALDYCGCETPRMILVDLGLPKINGLELTKMLRELPKLNKVPIIAVTAHTDLKTKEKASLVGCTDFIEKPFLPKDFLHIVMKNL